MTDWNRAWRMLRAGQVMIRVENEGGRTMTFKFTPALDTIRGTDEKLPWSGRKWWLAEDEHYIGLAEIIDTQTITIKRTAKSTDHRAANFAALLVTAALNDSEAIPDGYRFYVADRCGVCGKELADPESIRYGICKDDQ